jgi:hypothetical protein
LATDARPNCFSFWGFMRSVGVSLVIQCSLALGLAGLLWPEKLAVVFDILMFPWPSSYRTVRTNSIVALVLSGLLFLTLVTRH